MFFLIIPCGSVQVKREKSKNPPSAAELLKKILEIERRQANIKQKIYLLKLATYLSKYGHQPIFSHQFTVGRPCASQEVNRATHAGVMEPIAMKLKETQYLNILHSIGQAIHLYNVKQRIMFWNRAAENLYGYTAAEAYGKTPTELLVESKNPLMGNYVEERTTHGDKWFGVFPLIKNNGERFMACCVVTPYHDEYSRQLAAICISSDSRQYHHGIQAVCAPTTITSTSRERDSQQTLQTSTASKISNLVSKVKSKLKRGDYYKDHGDSAFNQSEGSTPRKHIGSSPFEMFFSMDTEEHPCGNPMIDSSDESENKCRIRKFLYSKDEEWVIKFGVLRPWKANDVEVESIHAKLGHSGWPRYNFSQGHEYGQQMRSRASSKLVSQLHHSEIHKIEALEMWLSTIQVSSESSMSSSSSGNMSMNNNGIIKVRGETDDRDYDIL